MGSCRPHPGRRDQRDKSGGGIHRNHHLVLGANKPAGGARHHRTSHLVATLLTFASGILFTVDGAEMDVGAFAFQLNGIVVVAATFAKATATGSAFLVVYEVVGMRRKGDEAEDLPISYLPQHITS